MKIYKMLSFWFGILLLLSMFLGTFMHEQVHVVIAEDHGLESEINWFEDFPHVSTTYYGECNEVCDLANEMNEAINYNFEDVKIMIKIGFLFIIILLELIYYKIKERSEYEEKH